MMRDLFSLFDLFNSYTTIFSIVLHLVFFVVIAPVIPKLKKKTDPFDENFCMVLRKLFDAALYFINLYPRYLRFISLFTANSVH